MNSGENKLPVFNTIRYESDSQLFSDVYIQEDEDSDCPLQIDEAIYENKLLQNRKHAKSDAKKKKRKQSNTRTSICENLTNDTSTSRLSLKFIKDTYKFQIQYLKKILKQPFKHECLTNMELQDLFNKYKQDGHFRVGPKFSIHKTEKEPVTKEFDQFINLDNTGVDSNINVRRESNYVCQSSDTSTKFSTNNVNNPQVKNNGCNFYENTGGNFLGSSYTDSFCNNLHEKGEYLQTHLAHKVLEKDDGFLHSVSNYWSYPENMQSLYNAPTQACSKTSQILNSNSNLEYNFTNFVLTATEQKENIQPYFDMNMYMTASPINIPMCERNFIDLHQQSDSVSNLAETHHMQNFNINEFNEVPSTVSSNVLLSKGFVEDSSNLYKSTDVENFYADQINL